MLYFGLTYLELFRLLYIWILHISFYILHVLDKFLELRFSRSCCNFRNYANLQAKREGPIILSRVTLKIAGWNVKFVDESFAKRRLVRKTRCSGSRQYVLEARFAFGLKGIKSSVTAGGCQLFLRERSERTRARERGSLVDSPRNARVTRVSRSFCGDFYRVRLQSVFDRCSVERDKKEKKKKRESGTVAEVDAVKFKR